MKKGFTLIETFVAMGIFGLIFLAVSGFILTLYKTQSYTWQQSNAIEEARRGIQIMAKEIRAAREGEDGSYPIEKAADKEFIFYSDIDNDGKAERVRYFLGTVASGSQVKECSTSAKGGTCSVNFINFMQGGTLTQASVKISLNGDFGWGSSEYAEAFADGSKLGELCHAGCTDCPASSVWQGDSTYNILAQAQDGSVQLLADATNNVDSQCPHSMKARFEFSWTEDLSGLVHQFKKGVIKPTGSPAVYDENQEKVSIITSYVRNAPPIFEYFDASGNKIVSDPARISDTKLMKLFLSVNVDPLRPPDDFELESRVQLRNLK